MLPRDESDAEVVDRVSRGDQDALRVLYRRYAGLVYGFATRVLGDSTRAEEVAQDVFLRVWEKAGTYRPEAAKVSTWLMRITRNRAIDVLRSARSAGHQAAAGWDDLEWAEDPAPGPPEDAASDHCREEVRAAVAALPLDQRRALSLAFFKGMTHREISDLVGEPLGTVKTRIRDAMRKLRGEISEECAP